MVQYTAFDYLRDLYYQWKYRKDMEKGLVPKKSEEEIKVMRFLPGGIKKSMMIGTYD